MTFVGCRLCGSRCRLRWSIGDDAVESEEETGGGYLIIITYYE